MISLYQVSYPLTSGYNLNLMISATSPEHAIVEGNKVLASCGVRPIDRYNSGQYEAMDVTVTKLNIDFVSGFEKVTK